MTHSELCKLAVRWLKRPHSRGGHGCTVAIDECITGWAGEIPDAIGFRFSGRGGDPGSGTVLVECKVTRSDFLADRSKPHRESGGVGNWRYFMAPQGVIGVEELPDKWGLVEVTAGSRLVLRRGAFSCSDMRLREARLIAMRQHADCEREFFLLTRLFDRVGDVEKGVQVAKERNRLAFRAAELSMKLHASERVADSLRWQVHRLEQELAQLQSSSGVVVDSLMTAALPRLA